MKLSVETNPEASDGLATEGTLYLDGVKFCYTLEPGRKDPERPKGPIPRGLYNVNMMFSPHFNREMPHVSNQEDKLTLIKDGITFKDVMIHPGNFPKDTEGCLMVGQTQGKDFIGSSQAAFDLLLPKILAGLSAGLVFIEYLA